MWACILNFEAPSHKYFIVDFSSDEIIQNVMILGDCFMTQVSISMINCWLYLFYFSIFRPILRCFLCGLHWPFTGGLGKKRERERDGRGEASSAGDKIY